MRLLAVLLTSNKALVQTFENSRRDLPAEILKNAGVSDCQLVTVCFEPRREHEEFPDFLGKLVGVEGACPPRETTYQGLVVLYSDDCEAYIRGIRDGVFSSDFSSSQYIEKRDNFLVQAFGRLIKNLFILRASMAGKTCMEAAILPAKNFSSKVFQEFVNTCVEHADEPQFQNWVTPSLLAVTELRGPRRRSKYPDRYFRDDQGLCFKYGHEVHASFETGGNHGAACIIRGLFRFGIPLEQQRHFNVMAEEDNTRISNTLPNCHGDPVRFERRTHLNMFSNDFFK